MGKLYGHQRWYEVERESEKKNKKTGKNIKFNAKVRVKREYENSEYKVRIDEAGEKTELENSEFIEKMIKIKESKGKSLKSKFNLGNVLFKLKMYNSNEDKNKNKKIIEADKIIKKVEVLSRTEKLSKSEITRAELIEELNKEEINLENGKLIKIKDNSIDVKIEISKQSNNSFDRKQDENIVRINILEYEEKKIRKDIYEKFININEKIHSILIKIEKIKNSDSKNEDFQLRYYDEKLHQKVKDYKEVKEIKKQLEEIKNIINEKIELKGFVEFYLNVKEGDGNNKKKKISNNKIIFVNKILNYLESDIEILNEDIIDYIIGELKEYGIIKRIENVEEKLINRYMKLDKYKKIKNVKEKEQIKEKNQKKFINTYIKLDKHEKLKIEKNKKDNIVKDFIDYIKNDQLKEKIKKIIEEFKIEELKNNLKCEIENGNRDTTLFGIYKEHYKKNIGKNYKEIQNFDVSKKELYKIIYRYIKGRIEKILVNRKEKNLYSKVEDWFDEKELCKKIEKRVKQYTLEYIMYLGKIEHNGIEDTDVNTETFQKLHAKEELDLELITFFSATNMELNKIFKGVEETTDFFGFDLKGQKISLKKNISNFKLNILKRMKFINEANDIENDSNFYDFQKKVYIMRNQILHSTGNKILYSTKNTCKDKYSDIEKLIIELKTSDEEISKALNLDIIYGGKNEIIKTINSLSVEESEEKKYFPSSTKIIPEVIKKFKEINGAKNFDNDTEKIILNAVKYVSKVLYEKIISNSESEFIKILYSKLSKLENKNLKNEQAFSIKEYYKKNQILSSKGDKKAIKKYQIKIIDEYIEYIEKNFLEIIDFSNFNLNFSEIETEISKRKESKCKIILKPISKKVNITNDVEYVFSILALLSNNTYINKVRNRLFATQVWLDTINFQNIIDILDEIISVNSLRENIEVGILELSNLILEAKILENDEEIIKKLVFENNIEEVKEKFLKLKNDDEKELVEILKNKKNNISSIIKKNKNDKFTIDFKAFDESEKIIIGANKVKLEKIIEECIVAYKSKIKNKYSSIFFENYRKVIDDLVENEKNKFEKIYYPEKRKGELYIYKKNLFLNIENSNFDNIYELISNDIKKIETKSIFDDDIRINKILEINEILQNLNDNLKTYSKEYKEKYVKRLEKDKEFFFKTIKKYESYEKFLEIYEQVSKYKQTRDLVEFNYLTKIESYLIEINWKLAIQMARFERDIHYIVKGLEKLGEIIIVGKDDSVSRAYKKYEDITLEKKSHYKFKGEDNNIYDEYNKFEEICKFFGIDLSANSEIQKEGNKSIRNYISHFYIIREPFVGYSILEQINKVSKIMEYSTRYNNSTYMSVFEVFKKDVNLKYDELKKKFELVTETESEDRKKKVSTSIETKKVSDLIEAKKVSVLELDNYNSEYMIELITKLLTKKIEKN